MENNNTRTTRSSGNKNLVQLCLDGTKASTGTPRKSKGKQKKLSSNVSVENNSDINNSESTKGEEIKKGEKACQENVAAVVHGKCATNRDTELALDNHDTIHGNSIQPASCSTPKINKKCVFEVEPTIDVNFLQDSVNATTSFQTAKTNSGDCLNSGLTMSAEEATPDGQLITPGSGNHQSELMTIEGERSDSVATVAMTHNMEELLKQTDQSKPIDNNTILMMFMDIKQTVGTINTSVKRLETSHETIISSMKSSEEKIKHLEEAVNKKTDEERSTQIESKVIDHDKRICELERIIGENRVANERMMETLRFQEQLINECKRRFDTQEYTKNKMNITIQGLKITSQKDALATAKEFFKEKMLIQQPIDITKAYKPGTYDSITVVLKKMEDKKLIFDNTANLKHKRNSKGKFYSIDSFKTAEKKESRRRNREVLKLNEKLSVAQKLVLTLKNGVIYEGENEYKGNIRNPSHYDIIQTTTEELNEIRQKYPVVAGIDVQKETSTFQGYVADVRNFDEVNEIYKLIRADNMTARHIICAAIVDGSHQLDTMGFEDDAEHGCGRVLLEYLRDIKNENRAIFVTRYTDGQQIKEKRFDGLLEAAKNAINSKPFNTVTQKYHFAWPTVKTKMGGGRKARYLRVQNLTEEDEDKVENGD